MSQQVGNDKSGKSQLEEAADIWNIAQELGATTDIEQGLVITKIKEMEERDRKEAERLGDRSHTP